MSRLPLWRQLQQYTAKVLGNIEEPGKETKGSGNVKGNGDVITDHLMLECKLRTRKNIIIDHDHWIKIREEAELIDRYPALVCKNRDNNIMISMDLDDFIEFIETKMKKAL